MAARLLLLVALSSCCGALRAVALQAGGGGALQPAAECSHDREVAFQSLRNRSGSLWLFHVTHNAGTSVLKVLQDNLAKSGKSALGVPTLQEGGLEPGRFYYGEVFGELGLWSSPLGEQVPCDSGRFVSVFPVRDPLPRILSADGLFTTTADSNTDGCNTQNYGLRKLIGKSFRENLTARDVEFAKRRLDSFDIILDVSTLHDSVGSMCAALGFTTCALAAPSSGHHGAVTRRDVLKAVGPAVYNTWMERNAPEIEVYEYARRLAAGFVRRYPSPSPPAPPADPAAPPRQAQGAGDDRGAERWVCKRR